MHTFLAIVFFGLAAGDFFAGDFFAAGFFFAGGIFASLCRQGAKPGAVTFEAERVCLWGHACCDEGLSG